MTEHPKVLSMAEVCEQTGLSATSVRTYIKQFELRTARTEHGHHRFPEGIISTLIAIKEKLQQHGWTYQQVQGWLQLQEVSGGAYDADEAAASSANGKLTADKPLEDKIVHVSRKLDELATLVQDRLDEGRSVQTERFRQLRDFVITEQVKARLRVQALKSWSELPEIKRTMRAGLFRRQEDVMKRETFIAEYIRERLEEELERELGLRETAATSS